MSTETSGSGQQSGSEIGRPRLLQRVHEAIRVRHYSRRTEEAYVHWIKRLIYFHGKRHPETVGEAEVTAFLNHLAVERHVAAATQNQALSAILFLYREVLVRDGKGAKDRVTMLPEKLVEPLRGHLERVRLLHARDLREGYGEVHLPYALARKYPRAGREWHWQFICRSFSGTRMCLPR